MGKVFGWISGKVTDLSAAAGRALVTSWARKWADGKYGPKWTKLYYWLSSHALHITGIVAFLMAGLEAAAKMPGQLALVGLTADQVNAWAVKLAYAIPVLLAIKVVTDQWHQIGHPSWLDHPIAKWLKAHGAVITYLMGVAWWYAEQCGSGGWCTFERWLIFLAGVFCAVTGIAPRADHSIPPVKVLEALAGLIAAPTPKVAEQAETIAALPRAEIVQEALGAVAARQISADTLPKAKQDHESAMALKSVSRAIDADAPKAA